jgi:hypothetical protein
VDPGSRKLEGITVGLLYQLWGRPTTIGTADDKFSLAMYFTGNCFNQERILEILQKTKYSTNKLYKKAALRKKWVAYLKENEVDLKHWSLEKRNKIFKWAKETEILLLDWKSPYAPIAKLAAREAGFSEFVACGVWETSRIPAWCKKGKQRPRTTKADIDMWQGVGSGTRSHRNQFIANK